MPAVRWIEDQPINNRTPFWTRANAGEVIPDPPSPLAWDLLWDRGGCIAGWRDCAVDRLGFGDDELDRDRCEMAGVIGGYLYLGATMTRVWAERTPGMSAAMIDAAYFGTHPDVPAYVHEPWHDNPDTTEKMVGWLGWVMGSMEQTELEADRTFAYEFRNSRPDLRSATDAALLDRAASVRAMCRRLFNQHINQTGAASIGPGTIGGVCAAIGRPEDALGLMSGLGGVDSAAPTYAIWDLSRLVAASPAATGCFEAGMAGLEERLRGSSESAVVAFVVQLDAFLAEWGSRGPNEWDLVCETWETKPELLLSLVDRMRALPDNKAPQLQTQAREAERTALIAEISAQLENNPDAAGPFAAGLASAAVFVPGRERSKTTIIRVIGEARVALRELGRRAVERGHLDVPSDLCMLFDDELRAYVDGTAQNIRTVVTDRKAHLAWLESLEPPFIINGAFPPVETWPKKSAHIATPTVVGEVLRGMPGCSGVVRGRACVVLDPSDPMALEPDDILVAPVTDPAWTPLFVPAAGVVVDVGAALSHAIIVSRELGIPCVVSVTDASKRIPHGAMIEVDGTVGTVTVLSLP